MRKKEIVGIGLVIIGAAGMLFSMRDLAPESTYFVATRDVAPGAHLSSTDFNRIPLELREAATHYISASAQFSNRKALRRIKKGEIIPRDAISQAESIEQRKQVTFALAISKTPQDLKSGDLVDVYFFKVLNRDLQNESVELLKSYEKVRVHSVSKSDSQFNGDQTVTLLLNPDDVREFLTLLVFNELTLVKGLSDE